MNDDFLLYKRATLFTYAASIASTWIWAPALFVSSGNAYQHGLLGFLLFWVPNVLTLILFGKFAEKVRQRADGVTVADALGQCSQRQKYLHTFVSLVVLVCSTAVQMLGFCLVFAQNLPVSKLTVCICVGLVAFATVGYGGLKHSIITDKFKWYVMFFFGLALLTQTYDNQNFSLIGYDTSTSPISLVLAFGVPTAIGLLCAPYVDQTFWQRVYSLETHNVKKAFYMSAVLFGLIPLVFGLVGFAQARTIANWNLGMAFTSNNVAMFLLTACVIAALLSTLDSNLCAVSAIVIKSMKQSKHIGRLSMVIVLLLSMAVVTSFDVTVTQLFLVYGTIRTCAAVPTVLIILDRYDEKRLFYATFGTVIIASLGYVFAPPQVKFLFTVTALLAPLLGYSSKREQN